MGYSREGQCKGRKHLLDHHSTFENDFKFSPPVISGGEKGCVLRLMHSCLLYVRFALLTLLTSSYSYTYITLSFE